jgi:peptidoglycan-associated lipoprotein
MKTMKLIYPLACALAFTLTTTGCHNHKAVGVTPIPGQNPGIVGGDNNPGTLPSAPPINPGDNGVNSANGIPVASINPGDYNEDRDTFAANAIHFAFDSAAIKSSEESNLSAVADKLKTDANLKLQIEGNCDDRGTDEYNRSLGERRALAAREALAKLGVDPSRVRTISYGKDKPVDTGHDEAAWAKNRRDDFVLLHPKTGA